MGNNEYQKKINKLRLNSFQEYKILNFSKGTSLIVATFFALFAIDFFSRNVSLGMMAVSFLYLVTSFYMSWVQRRLAKDILSTGQISDATRRLGVPMIFFILTSNFFALIAGFNLTNKKKSIEFQLCIYMVLIDILVLVVSMLTIFKSQLAPMFFIGMVVLFVVLVFHIFVMKLVSARVDENQMEPKMKKLLIPLLVTTVTGNLFALILAVVIYQRLHQKNKEVSIELLDILRRIFRNYTSCIGMLIVVFFLAISLCSNLTYDYSWAEKNNYDAMFLKPSLEYPFGTDNFGRCVLSRIIFGAGISLVVGMTATIIPLILGSILGALAGFYIGRTDNLIMRLLDVLYAVPSIMLAIAIIAAFGASTITLIIAISVTGIPVYARIVRGQVMSLSNSEYTEAARACGATDSVVIFRHILPNAYAPIIVRATMEIGTAVLSTSALSYLGIGIPSYVPEWGNVLKVGSTYLEQYPYLAIFPGLAIMLLVLSFNFFGDGLRDALDPKMK